MQLCVAFVLSSYLVYVIYTPLHEAVHRNISGTNRGGLLWLNHAVGYLSATLLGVSYTMHKAAHMTHHRATNVEGEDPDFVTRGSSLGDVLSCGVKNGCQRIYGLLHPGFPKAPLSERATVIAEIVVFVGWRVALCFAGFTLEVVVLAVLANLAGANPAGVHLCMDRAHTVQSNRTHIVIRQHILLPSLSTNQSHVCGCGKTTTRFIISFRAYRSTNTKTCLMR